MGHRTSKVRAPRNAPTASYRRVNPGPRSGPGIPGEPPYNVDLGMVMERKPRDRQRGNSLVLALIVMSALATLGSLTVVSVQSSLKTSTNDRSQTIALYAAESGAAYAMDFLRAKGDWTPYLTPANIP